MAEMGTEVVALYPRGFETAGEQEPKLFHIGVFSVAGRRLADVELGPFDRVLDLRRAIRQLEMYATFKLLSGTALLADTETLLEAGLCDNSVVHVVAISMNRFIAGDETTDFGLYLLYDGTAEAFCCSKRVVNQREDEEHTQRLFWGSWSCAGGTDPKEEGTVSVLLSDFERNVFNEAAMSGWTSRSGRAALPAVASLDLWPEDGGVRFLPNSVLRSALGSLANGRLPHMLDRVPDEANCFFDAWHDAGTSTIP